ncbi:MAG: PAS domain S-box protein [bacterium]
MLVADGEGQVIFLNPTAENLTGWRCDDAFGKSLHEVFRAASEESEQPIEISVIKVAHGDNPLSLRHTVLTAKNGVKRAIDGSCAPLKDEQQKVLGIVLVFREIEEYKHIQDALRESEEKYRRLVENSRDVIMLTQPDGIISYLSPACREVLGYEPEDLVGKQPWIVHPDDLAQVKEIHYRALTGEGGTNAEYRILTKTGEIKWVSHSWSPIFVGHKFQMLASTVRDITEQKRTGEILQEALSRFEAVIENTPLVAIQGFDCDGVIRHWNSTCKTLYGYRASEIVGKRLQDVLLSGEAARKFERAVQQICRSGQATPPQEWTVCTRTGEERWVYSTMFPVFAHGRIHEIFCMDVDITDRKRAEEAVRVQRDLAQSYLDLAGVIFVALNADGHITLVNKMGCKVLGYEERELLRRNWFDTCLPQRLRTDVRSVFRKLIAGEIEPVEYYENPIVTKDGQERIIAWHNTILRDAEGRIVGTLSSGEDITERKRAEEALKESEERYRRMFEQSADAILIEDLEGHILELNTAACQLMKAKREALLGRTFSGFLSQGSLDMATILHRLRAGERVLFEASLTPADGHPRIVRSSIALITYGEEERVQIISRDVTEQKRAEEQLFQAQKMESIATLAGGVAHDFNNLMTTVLGRASLLRDELGAGHPADIALSVIEKTAARAGHLARQLLAYARVGKYQPQVVNLNTILQDILRLQEHIVPPNIRLEEDLCPSLPNIVADPTQMQQIVMNLCLNAVEAMPEGGRIRFQTGEARVTKKDTKTRHDLAPGRYVRLAVQDTGEGMDQETLSRIFEPFFTTKDIGRGLGLAAVYGIVVNHAGAVTAESEVGRGTTFTMYFPATTAKARKAKAPRTEALHGEETILIIDDEESVLSITERILQRLGYRVLLASSGQEGIEITRSHKGPIHLVLLDLSMPLLPGSETYPQLIALRPDMKVLVSSGYALDEQAQKLLDAGAQGFVQKPYSIDTLARHIREILNRE